MCHLVMDSSNEVQKMAYQMLREAAKKYTEDVVVEAAVDSEGSYSAVMPSELIDILSRTIDAHEDGVEVSDNRLALFPCSEHLPDHIWLSSRMGSDIRSLCWSSEFDNGIYVLN
jgi:hypothetical protein